MGENSAIEWCDHTFNPWIGCQKVSPGCDHCYAEALSKRYGWVEWGPHGERKQTSEANWRKPLQWAKRANGRRPRVFCASLADVFDNQVPEHWRMDLWSLIRDTPEIDWLLLTKRPENIHKMIPWAPNSGTPYRNIWLGTTAEDQAHYNRRWPILQQISAAVHFISHEPSLGPLTRLRLVPGGPVPDWVICGGESGSGARYMEPVWARALHEECAVVGAAFFMKQMTGKKPIPPDLMVRQFPVS